MVVSTSDGKVLTASSKHPNFKEIVDLLTSAEPKPVVQPKPPTPSYSYSRWGTPPVKPLLGEADPELERLLWEEDQIEIEAKLRDLFDATIAVGEKFEKLSERVSVSAGRIFFDGSEVDDVLAEQVLRFQRGGLEFQPLVNFWEKIATNPNEHSRENLYRWLKAQGDFTIDPDGDLIAYKGLRADHTSVHSGPAVVNGVQMNGNIPNQIGSVITMPRSKVHHDPSQGCSVGLHAGTFGYASTFGNGVTAKVKINPRDVVSVPTDSGDAKMRVCQYEVLEVTDAPVRSPLYGTDYGYANAEYGEWDEDDFDDLEDTLDEVEDDDVDAVEVPTGALRSILGALRNATKR